MERQRVAEQAKGVGRPKVGGTFQLLDHEGKQFSDGDMKGGFSLVGVSGWMHIWYKVEPSGKEKWQIWIGQRERLKG